MRKILFSLSLLLTLFSCSMSSVSAATCPLNEINGDSVTIAINDVCNIPAEHTYVLDKVVGETSTVNTANLQVSGGSLTISNNAVLKTGTVTLPSVGGSIIVQNGGTIIIGGTAGAGLWVTDSDADGYAANFTTYTATASGRRRLGLMKSKTVADCLDSNIAKWQNISGYVDVDADSYGAGAATQVCSGASLASGYVANNTDCSPSDNTKWRYLTGYRDADADTFGTSASSQVCSGSSLASGYVANNTDCWDSNANAKPGSAYCSATNRGDGVSYDYNCDGLSSVCSPYYYSSAYSCIGSSYNWYVGQCQCFYETWLTGNITSCGGVGYSFDPYNYRTWDCFSAGSGSYYVPGNNPAYQTCN